MNTLMCMHFLLFPVLYIIWLCLPFTFCLLDILFVFERFLNFDISPFYLTVYRSTSKCNTGDIFLPIPSGTNIFSIYNPIQSVNAIIPDIFRLCAIKNPIEFEDSVSSTRVSPKIKVGFEDTSLGTAINVTRFQQLIPENIIKAFFYFGYKSNFENFNFSELNFLEKKIENYVKISQTNNSKYTDPEVIFNSIYGTDTLIQKRTKCIRYTMGMSKKRVPVRNAAGWESEFGSRRL